MSELKSSALAPMEFVLVQTVDTGTTAGVFARGAVLGRDSLLGLLRLHESRLQLIDQWQEPKVFAARILCTVATQRVFQHRLSILSPANRSRSPV